MVIEFTNGDMSMISKLVEFKDDISTSSDSNNEWTKKQVNVNEYLQPAFELYFQKAGINPFEGE